MRMEYTETVFSVNPNYTVLDIPPRADWRDYTGMEFTANMKRYRKAQDIRQEELAETIGVSQATVQRWENGKREPSHADLEALAKALGVHVADLFREGPSNPIPDADELARMIERAMAELPVGVTYADYHDAVAASLRAQLEQYQAAGGFLPREDEESAHDTTAPPRAPTRQSVSAGSRSQ